VQESRTEAQQLLEGMMILSDFEPDDAPILKLGFGYPGSKADQLDNILPRLPRSKVRVDLFGGSGAVLMNSPQSPLEVYNDRCSGVTAFFRCCQDRELLEVLKERIRLMIYSKEEWLFTKESWASLHHDTAERAARWFYTLYCSFAGKMNEWGRQRKPGANRATKFNDLPLNMEKIHARVQQWEIVNDDFMDVLRRYDSHDTVFYIDPTYYNSTQGMYTHELSKPDHVKMLMAIENLEGFVALSGYPNEVYDKQFKYLWDDRIEWHHTKKTRSGIACEENGFQGADLTNFRPSTTEVLWIKEFK
jgi:DNA adenine methylase